MSISMLRHNIEMLSEVSDNYYRLVEKKGSGDKTVDSQITNLKTQILFLQTAIKKSIDEEKNG
mgnify:FL=1